MLQFGSAALGSLLGGSVGIGSRTGWMLGSLIAGQFGKKPVIEGRRLEDLTVQTSTYGKAIPLIYGRALLKGNIIWSNGITEIAKSHKERVSLLTRVKVKDYQYTASLAIGLCEGETKGLQRIWANGKLIYDKTPENGGKVKAFPFKIRFYTGTENQKPDALILKHHSDAPAFRGLSYVIFEDFPLEDFNNHVPKFTFEVSREIAPQTRVIEVSDTNQESDNICFSKVSPWLFLRDGNKVICINRDLNKIEEVFDFTDKLPKTNLFRSKLFGHLTFDPVLGCLYAFAQHQLSTFLLKLDPLTGMVQTHNFDEKIIGDEQVGFIDGQLFYSADFLKGIIRVYQTSDLSRLYEINGAVDSGLHLRPTNFTKDEQGRIWLASYDPTNNQDFYLTRVRGQETADHYKISDYGQASGVIYDKMLQKIVVCSAEGLIVINPDTGQVEGHIQEAKTYGTSFAQSTFANCPVTEGKLWLAKNGEAIQVDLVAQRIGERVTFRASFHGSTFDPDQQALWFKGGCLSKLLLGRRDAQALNLPDVIDNLLRRAGFEADELQIDLREYPVHGAIVSHPMPVGKALAPLKQADFFYVRSHGGRLNCFYPEDKDPILIKASDVGAADENRQADQTLLREPSEELPREVEVLYPSVERRFGTASRKSRLHAKPCSQVFRLEIPLLMRDEEAQHIADRLLALAWQRRSSIIFTLPPKCIHLEVGDRLLVEEQEILITEITHTPKGLIEVEGWTITKGRKQ